MKNQTYIVLLVIIFISSCAVMNAKPIEEQCYTYQKFAEVANCTIKQVSEAYKIPRNRNLYQLYSLKAQELSTLVSYKSISDDDAKHHLSLYRTKLEMMDSQKLQDAFDIMPENNQQVNTVISKKDIDKKVYNYDECIGTVIMGRCHGSIIDKGGYHKTCHGEWLNGQCTGPYF